MFSSLGTKIALRKAGLGGVSLPKTDGLFGNGNTKKGNTNGAEGGDTGFANPFANVQWGVPKALQSWTTPPPPQNPVRKSPNIGDRAQSHPKLQFPTADGRPTILLFLRFCGCPFSEKLFLTLRTLANKHTSIHFVAISHCTPAATTEWVKKLGGAWNVDVVVDQDRELYALWGLGIATWGHVLHPRNGYNQVMLRKNEGVWGQLVGEGACRWQVGGSYSVDGRGVVTWGGPMQSADEAIPFEHGVMSLGYGETRI
ncbi:hypothetical protein J4E93_007706 [Alternaria ventricosa]|uniref:uncharacterized protein n=1 Tax=Alternaria ventricosa TaxID=1187951 RepID=UPI0020C422C3|nr:uncharacterized protein J4E93_007706 [Alternaria ventricosa]KAI4641609.1 hypothetical protein J4E93_007706 [Alternaria ventricosa]